MPASIKVLTVEQAAGAKATLVRVTGGRIAEAVILWDSHEALRRERDFQQKGWLETLAREREWFKERDKLREGLRWALEHTHYRVSRGGLWESDRCLYCKQILKLPTVPNQGHASDCPYTRALALLAADAPLLEMGDGK